MTGAEAFALLEELGLSEAVAEAAAALPPLTDGQRATVRAVCLAAEAAEAAA